MGSLRLTTGTPQADEVYQQLLTLHEGCDAHESLRRNAKLILLLANHIGDPQVIAEAVAIAQRAEPES
ncbi:MAG: DUF2783 domain-containing protein [Pseudomonadota bacterium]